MKTRYHDGSAARDGLCKNAVAKPERIGIEISGEITSSGAQIFTGRCGWQSSSRAGYTVLLVAADEGTCGVRVKLRTPTYLAWSNQSAQDQSEIIVSN